MTPDNLPLGRPVHDCRCAECLAETVEAEAERLKDEIVPMEVVVERLELLAALIRSGADVKWMRCSDCRNLLRREHAVGVAEGEVFAGEFPVLRLVCVACVAEQ